MARKEIERTARERLGFDRLRPGQADAVEALLGPTVVVSPPIALQRDRVEDLVGYKRLGAGLVEERGLLRNSAEQ